MYFQCRDGVKARTCHYGENSRTEFQFDFLSDGGIRCDCNCPTSCAYRMTWEQYGTTVKIDANEGYAIYWGTISRDRMYGTGSKKSSAVSSGFVEWDWTAARLK